METGALRVSERAPLPMQELTGSPALVASPTKATPVLQQATPNGKPAEHSFCPLEPQAECVGSHCEAEHSQPPPVALVQTEA